jgi:hypothetical protein
LNKTILLITSDHGHHSLPRNKTISINDYPDLLDDLNVPPTGSSRSPFIYPKKGKQESVKRFINQQFGSEFGILNSRECLKKGLFGFGKMDNETRSRIGNQIIFPSKGQSFHYSYKPKNTQHFLKGGHGGLSEDEMLVPLIVFPLWL